MGQGIIGTIPLSFRFKKNRWEYHEAEGLESKKCFAEYAAKDFFDYYDVNQNENEKGGIDTVYTIKPEILLPNFKSFYFEFQNLIGNDENSCKQGNIEKFDCDYDRAVALGKIDEFLKHFDDNSGWSPTIYSYFEAIYIDTFGDDLLVYQGSYKAFLEVWSTLIHMEKMLRAAMPQQPLAKVFRFGFG